MAISTKPAIRSAYDTVKEPFAVLMMCPNNPSPISTGAVQDTAVTAVDGLHGQLVFCENLHTENQRRG